MPNRRNPSQRVSRTQRNRIEYQRTPAEILQDEIAPSSPKPKPLSSRRIKYYFNAEQTQQIICVVLGFLNFIVSTTSYIPTIAKETLLKKDGHTITEEKVLKMVEIQFFAASLGSFVAGVLLYKKSRKLLLNISMGGVLIAYYILLTCTTHSLIIGSRALSGLCLGILTTTSKYYSCEVVTKKFHRLADLVVPLSEGMAFLVMVILQLSSGWDFIMRCGIKISIFALTLVSLLPESPEFHYKAGDTEEAYMALEFIAGGDKELAKKEYELMEARMPVTSSNKAIKGTHYAYSIQPIYTTTLLYMCQQLTGIKTYLYFIPTVMLGIDKETNASCDAVTIAVLNLAAYMIFIRNQEFTKRKRLLKASSIYIGIFSIFLGLVLFCKKYFEVVGFQFLFLTLSYLCISLMLLAYNYGWASVPDLVYREFVPYAWKDDSTFLYDTVRWIAAGLASDIFTNVMSMEFLFCFFGVLTIVSFKISDIILVETLGKSPDNLYVPGKDNDKEKYIVKSF